MSVLYGILVVLHILVCLFLIVVILLQAGKGAGLSAMFGGQSDSMFGGQGAAKPLSVLTTIVAALFMVTCLSLSYMSRSTITNSVTDTTPNIPGMPMGQGQPVQAPNRAPAQNAPAAPAAPVKTAPTAPAPAAPAAPAQNK
jgi:preprotein translocase subunit SecG